ncbi:MAG: nucleoside-diphosphate kinase [Lentisphaerae bacterium]|nr:MAG: nucleoside-diphosphate kinase [Lentisphaerota bacterium]
MYEYSLVIIKPDGVQRRLIGEVLQRFERSGFKIHAMRLLIPSRELVEEHYAEHKEKPFFNDVCGYLSGGPCLAFILGGHGAIARIRKMVGATTPCDAEPGTIRGDFAHIPKGDYMIYNIIHASANSEDAARECKLWFGDEVWEYDMPDDVFHGNA